MKQKRGSPKKHWTDIARLKIWYGLLLKSSGMNNNQLGHIFGWRDGQKPSSSNERCMTFYRIQNNHQSPQGRDPRWRSMNEIVDAVNLEEDCGGLKEIYTSIFWSLLKLNNISFLKIKELIQDVFKKHQIKRVDKHKDANAYKLLLINFNECSIYEESFDMLFIRIDDIDALEIVALLYLEAKAINSEITSLLEALLDNKLNNFFDAMVGTFTENNYYLTAINHLRIINVQLTRSNVNHIERYKKESMMPVYF